MSAERGSGRQRAPAPKRRPGRWALCLAAAVLLLGVGPADRQQAGRPVARAVAATPPMGWDTWNTFGCDISEQLIERTADAIVASGLRAAGYRYVIVDDCWFDPARDSAGDLQASPTRFPSGMRALGDYLHARGLKFGLYEAPGATTCAQYAGNYPGATGSRGHEAQDARQFAAWGVDYLKYDWCSPSGTIGDQLAGFSLMRDALAATGRPIVFSINPNSIHATTGPQIYWGAVANLWRTTKDITNRWDTAASGESAMGIKNIIDANVGLAGYAAPGGFNDPDMLEVGRAGLSETEMRSHFAVWAMMAAPLIAGNDLRALTSSARRILANPALIAIDQDPLGRQAIEVSGTGTTRVLLKHLSNGDVAVALLNEGDSAATISTTIAALGLRAPPYALRDAWTGTETVTTQGISATVAAHGAVVLRVGRSDH